MRRYLLAAILLCFSFTAAFAQPLPCPPINTTFLNAQGDATVCTGGCPWPIAGPIPGDNSAATVNCIMGAYYDIDPQEGGQITWAIYGTAPCRTFVVSWANVPLFNTGFCPGQFGTEQIVLYETTYA